MKLSNGYLQVYTGNGKGKTTAALGLTLRAAGAGLRIWFAQFIKSGCYSEITALHHFADNVSVHQYGDGAFIPHHPTPLQIEQAQAGLSQTAAALRSGDYDLVILDEANAAVSVGLFSIHTLLQALTERHEATEAVVTGRDAHPQLLQLADLVTEMREVKHYYQRGCAARIGIEH
jgi:cob(I)alamin adenosyltransferase